MRLTWLSRLWPLQIRAKGHGPSPKGRPLVHMPLRLGILAAGQAAVGAFAAGGPGVSMAATAPTAATNSTAKPPTMLVAGATSKANAIATAASGAPVLRSGTNGGELAGAGDLLAALGWDDHILEGFQHLATRYQAGHRP